MSIYRWAKLDDQSGPDRSIELIASCYTEYSPAMPTLYSRWISDWEYKLATRDSNRVVRRFEWGLDWLGMPPSHGSSSQALREFVRGVLADSSPSPVPSKRPTPRTTWSGPRSFPRAGIPAGPCSCSRSGMRTNKAIWDSASCSTDLESRPCA